MEYKTLWCRDLKKEQQQQNKTTNYRAAVNRYDDIPKIRPSTQNWEAGKHLSLSTTKAS